MAQDPAQRLADYVDYYRVRAERAAESGHYPASAAVERERYEAIASCEHVEEFEAKNAAGDFGNRLGVAQARDQASIRLKHYRETKQDVRAAGQQAILDMLEGVGDVQDLITKLGEAENAASLAITIDGMADRVADDIPRLEALEVLERAEVPDKWREERERSAAAIRASAAESFAEQSARNREYQPDWRLDYTLVREDRHRRVIPLPDAVLERRLAEHPGLVGLDGGA